MLYDPEDICSKNIVYGGHDSKGPVHLKQKIETDLVELEDNLILINQRTKIITGDPANFVVYNQRQRKLHMNFTILCQNEKPL